MKKSIFVFVICVISLISFSFFYFSKEDRSGTSRDIVLQFVTYNGYGNNLYIDNVLTGIQQNIDITVTAIVNIPYDTVYATQQSGIDSVSPIVSVSNIGRTGTADSTVKVFLEINPGGYIDSAFVPGLGSGITVQNTFSKFYYQIGTPYFLKAYTSYDLDSNRTNDTLRQYSISLPGFERMVLYEEFTSNSSPSCANNNTPLNQFVNRNISTVAAIKYHTGLLGLDSFYIQNPLQQDARMRYYYVSSVPTTIADGGLPVTIPYGDSVNLYNPYFAALAKGTPVSMTVLDENVSADSIKTTIDINIVSPVPAGNYVLSINAIERYINLPGQGTNGETQFYDVFREFFPDSNGIAIPMGVGNYHYEYTYYVQPNWVDSMIYTTVYIQNKNNREILNCAKGRNIIVPQPDKIPSKVIYEKSDLLNVHYSYRNSYPKTNGIDTIQTALNVELFESYFPPIGWKVFNQDGYITFQQVPFANGPTIGGSKSVIMDFFDYNIIGQRDSMYSKVYRNLLEIDTVRFDYAYAQYTTLGTNIDSLTVKISTDGGITFPSEIFRKGGIDLATAPQTTSFFIPSVSSQWRSFKFSLNGIVSIDDNFISVPSKFLLNQNYPNPFNPTTTISYELPVGGFVKLIIYDMLGKEVVTLLNEKQSAGIHQADFNASNLSSGIYFYQLRTEGFSDTKRMVLLK